MANLLQVMTPPPHRSLTHHSRAYDSANTQLVVDSLKIAKSSGINNLAYFVKVNRQSQSGSHHSVPIADIYSFNVTALIRSRIMAYLLQKKRKRNGIKMHRIHCGLRSAAERLRLRPAQTSEAHSY